VELALSKVVINNINFGLTFRKQFAVMMGADRNDHRNGISAESVVGYKSLQF